MSKRPIWDRITRYAQDMKDDDWMDLAPPVRLGRDDTLRDRPLDEILARQRRCLSLFDALIVLIDVVVFVALTLAAVGSWQDGDHWWAVALVVAAMAAPLAQLGRWWWRRRQHARADYDVQPRRGGAAR